MILDININHNLGDMVFDIFESLIGWGYVELRLTPIGMTSLCSWIIRHIIILIV